MSDIIVPGGSTLFLGNDANNQGSVAIEQFFRFSGCGNNLVALVDTKGDAAVIRDRYKLWLQVRGVRPEYIKDFYTCDDWHRVNNGRELYEKLLALTGGVDGRAQLVILRDMAGDMLAPPPEHPWFALVEEANFFERNATFITAISTGPQGMPAPNYFAHRVYRVQSSGTAMALRVTPIDPQGPVMLMHGLIAPGGIVIVNEGERP